jgi:hypothetical protein
VSRNIAGYWGDRHGEAFTTLLMEDSNKEWADDVDEAESEPSLMINLYFKFCRPHYNVQLESIAVNGQVLSIDSAVFSVAKNPWGLHGLGTFLNSGITLAFLLLLFFFGF